MENRIHLIIPNQDLKAIKEAIKVLEDKLGPHLKTLTTDDRRKVVKMGESGKPFVRKIVEYTKSDGQFLPAFVDREQLEVDMNAVDTLHSFNRPLSQLMGALNDSILLSGSEAMQAALAYYQSVKQAARLNVPDAKVIVDDLSSRFEGQGRKSTSAPVEV
ncbi:MAG: hypothetical protein RLO17_07230 [Cyclobacteriaceae bacterium]